MLFIKFVFNQVDSAITYQEAKDTMEDFGQVLTVLFNSSKIDNEELYCIIDNLVGLETIDVCF